MCDPCFVSRTLAVFQNKMRWLDFKINTKAKPLLVYLVIFERQAQNLLILNAVFINFNPMRFSSATTYSGARHSNSYGQILAKSLKTCSSC